MLKTVLYIGICTPGCFEFTIRRGNPWGVCTAGCEPLYSLYWQALKEKYGQSFLSMLLFWVTGVPLFLHSCEPDSDSVQALQGL